MRCDQCQFYSFPSSECRVRSPVFAERFQGGQFPTVAHGDWCGDFRADQLLIDYAGSGLSADDLAARRKQMQSLYDKRKSR